jgi:hypothetical protein
MDWEVLPVSAHVLFCTAPICKGNLGNAADSLQPLARPRMPKTRVKSRREFMAWRALHRWKRRCCLMAGSVWQKRRDAMALGQCSPLPADTSKGFQSVFSCLVPRPWNLLRRPAPQSCPYAPPPHPGPLALQSSALATNMPDSRCERRSGHRICFSRHVLGSVRSKSASTNAGECVWAPARAAQGTSPTNKA